MASINSISKSKYNESFCLMTRYLYRKRRKQQSPLLKEKSRTKWICCVVWLRIDFKQTNAHERQQARVADTDNRNHDHTKRMRNTHTHTNFSVFAWHEFCSVKSIPCWQWQCSNVINLYRELVKFIIDFVILIESEEHFFQLTEQILKMGEKE